jgi:S1-C subfamily serine protease
VVRITTQGAFEFPDGMFEEGFTGSGFLIDPTGIIVTNNHVVAGAALIDVYFSDDETPHRARLLGVSECSDVALIKIDGEDLPYLEWYEGDVKLGMDVYSLGYPLGDPEYTQHQGTISKRSSKPALSKTDVSEAFEHDAIVNPGSSGGPLVTEDGKVVGINYASDKSTSQSWAITYKEVKPILEELKEGKDVLSLGINGETWLFDDGSSGMWVYSVASGSVADKTGLKAGDFVMELEGIQLGKQGNMSEYCGILRSKGLDSTIGVKVYRLKTDEILEGPFNGRELEVTTSGGGTTTTTDQSDTQTTESGGEGGKWTEFVAAGDKSKTYVSMSGSTLVFELPSAETYSYAFLDGPEYGDVVVTASAKMIKGGTNAVAVICRASDAGWYELRVNINGQYTGSYEVYRYDPILKERKQNPYVNLLKGYERINSVNIKNGINSVNNISISCVGDEITLFINSDSMEEVRNQPIVIKDSVLTSGSIGVGSMSYGNGSIQNEFDTNAMYVTEVK